MVTNPSKSIGNKVTARQMIEKIFVLWVDLIKSGCLNRPKKAVCNGQ